MSDAFHPVSLGSTCEPKYQLSRHVFFRLFPNATQAQFEQALLHAQPALFARQLFDWQITGFGGVTRLLAEDFADVFEREDLEPAAASGRVINTRIGAYYPHDFPPPTALSHADIDAGYAHARQRIGTGVERFREHLKTAGCFLYVHKRTAWFDPEPLARERLEDLLALLRARSPAHRCALLLIEDGDAAEDWSEPEAELYRRAVDPCRRPQVDRWKGDDASWDRVLWDFPLTLNNVIRRPAKAG